jgi:flagellar protein FliO/FliZ
MDWQSIARALAALALTVGLILAFAWVARRYGLIQQAGQGGGKRLKLVEHLWLDAGRTRAAIVRFDDQDHLVILSPTAAQAVAVKPVAAEAHP